AAYRMADGLEHPLHLVLATLVDRQLDPPAREPADAGWSAPAVVELHARSQPPERALAGIPLDLHLVDLVDLVARVREAVRELPVVRQQQRARRVRVQAADGRDA